MTNLFLSFAQDTFGLQERIFAQVKMIESLGQREILH